MANGEIIAPILISFVLSVALGPLLIPFLKRIKAGQTVREDGPPTHLKKTGTPTMGGILILASDGNGGALCRALSENSSGTSADTGIWTDRLSG